MRERRRARAHTMPPITLHLPLKHCLLSLLCLCTVLITVCRPYPMSVWTLEELAQAPLLVTVRIEQSTPSVSPALPGKQTVPARATLLVVRCFPPLAVHSGERIELDHEALPMGHSGMDGPAVPNLREGSIVILALKANPRPTTDAWHLIADEGGGLVIPAGDHDPAGAELPVDADDPRRGQRGHRQQRGASSQAAVHRRRGR